MDQHTLLQFASRQSLSAFIQRFFPLASGGNRYLHNWHIDLIAEHLEKCFSGEIKRLIINVPPRSMKSICASVGAVRQTRTFL